MNILVIDDNVAICEALKELLISAGMTVNIVNNMDKAAEAALDPTYSFVILDADMFGGNGLKIIDHMSNMGTDSKSNILVITMKGVAIPTDNPYIKEVVTKPFLSTEILESLERIRSQELLSIESIDTKPKNEFLTSLFPAMVPKEPVKIIKDVDVEFGKSYVLFQDTVREVYSLTALFGSWGCDLCMITSTKDKAMKERFRGYSIETMRLVPVGRDEFTDTYGLGTMFNKISDFISRSNKSVVIIDNLNTLIYKNGMNSVLTFIHEVLVVNHGKPFSLIVSVNARDFTDKDKDILKNHLNYCSLSVKKEGSK